MSFQGDVGGIGLAELLQSLARGREGVLTLISHNELRATIGMQSGQLYFLPEPEEDPEIWRTRVRQAWVQDPDFRVDSLRMTDIARAQRMENLFTLLDSEQVHFRFQPGPLPQRAEHATVSPSEPGTAREGGRADGVFCTPAAVEGLLLEYARLKDEAASSNLRFKLPGYVLLVPAADPPPGRDFASFYAELDGRSTLQELADRLGWPLRQAHNLAASALVQNRLRVGNLEELYELGAREMADGNFGRAAARLRAWIEHGRPGPLSDEQASYFATQWQAGNLGQVLRLLSRRLARRLLRRMASAHHGPVTPRELWTEFLKLHPGDKLVAYTLLLVEIRASRDAHHPPTKDLIAAARAFQAAGSAQRAAALWRVAAARNPEQIDVRLDIGLGLLAADLTVEGLPWVVDAAGTLIEHGKPELALEPLHRALEADPMQRDARRLLSRARTQVVRRTITRKNSLITIALVVALACGALVTYGVQRQQRSRVAAVRELLDKPHEALALLEQQFVDDDSAVVHDLREELTARAKELDNAARTAWTDRYREAQIECTIGEARLGLERTLALPAAPRLLEGQDPLPLVSDLYNGLSARCDKLLKELGAEVLDTPEQLQGEERLTALVAGLREVLQAQKDLGPEAREFATRLAQCEGQVREREQLRSAARAEKARRDNLLHQDLLLATARTRAQAGEYAAALDAYKELIATDRTGKIAGLVKKEMDEVVAKGGALVRARELALEGKHAEALKLLEQTIKDPERQPLPWKLETFPAGAKVRTRDGEERTTPCVFETTRDARFELVLELAGCDSVTLRIEGPRDRFQHLSRRAASTWKAPGRVEALPCFVDGGHIVCDRAGNVVRIGPDGRAVWERSLQSLSGIARTPVRAADGRLLLLSEDGEAWLLDPDDGALEGPHRLRAPPIEGPIATPGGLLARLKDGSLARWTAGAEPQIVALRDLGPEHDEFERQLAASGSFGGRAGLQLLRRRTDSATRLGEQGGVWSVEIGPEVFLVRRTGQTEPAFSIARRGEWSYLAWEADGAATPRLWIADEGGLASYRP